VHGPAPEIVADEPVIAAADAVITWGADEASVAGGEANGPGPGGHGGTGGTGGGETADQRAPLKVNRPEGETSPRLGIALHPAFHGAFHVTLA
jgi:hypothetical protein